MSALASCRSRIRPGLPELYAGIPISGLRLEPIRDDTFPMGNSNQAKGKRQGKLSRTCLPNEVHIYLFRLGEPAEGCLNPTLSSEECVRAGRFVEKRDRDLFITAHSALRVVLSGYTHQDPASLEFRANMQGKPSLLGGEIQFNMSHSYDAVAIAVSRDVVGIDIEYIRPGLYDESLSKSLLAPCEREWLQDQKDVNVAFHRIWTLKEAGTKADGRGLSLDCASVAAIPCGIEEISPVAICSTTWWGIELSSPADFCLSVVTRQRSPVFIRY